MYAVDLGVSFDWSALVVGNIDPATGKFIVRVVRTWRPEPGRPVDLMRVEEEIVDLSRRWPVQRLVCDAWNASLLISRLRNIGIPAKTVGIDPTRLSRVTTLLKSAFSRRAIEIPRHERDLIEQLDSLEITEGSMQSARRDLVKLQPGGTFGAAAHDDVAVAVGLALESCEKSIGMLQLPPMTTCWRAYNMGLRGPDCYLAGRSGMVPPGNEPSCKECPAHQAVRQMFAKYLADGGTEYGSIRDFYFARIQVNDYFSQFRYAGALRSLGL